MKVEELLSYELVRLPKTQPTDVDFSEYVNGLLDQYMLKVKKVKFPRGSDRTKILRRLQYLIDGIGSTLHAYYRGNPFDAYRRIRDALNKSKAPDVWKRIQINERINFYRLRIKDANYPLSKEDLYHIPFHLRGRVATQRYSIPGFPSLYLSNSIYVAWEEMRRPNMDLLQAARFKNVTQLDLLDLTTSRYLGDYKVDKTLTMISDLIMWPLIAACSIKVRAPKNHFKPEYIIPQLLLQWIRNNKSIDGLIFSSTHIDLNEMKSSGSFYNFVIPVQENKVKGYCDKISKMFNMTDVLSWQLQQFSSGAPGVINRYSVSDGINPEIQRIELIKSKVVPYDFSPLATLENALNGMKLFEIDLNTD